MSLRVKTDDLISNLGFTAQLAVSKATAGKTIHEATAKAVFDPFLWSLYEGLKKDSGKAAIEPSALEKAFQAAGEGLIRKAAGVGRSAAWVSRIEASTLPASLQAMYSKLQERQERSHAAKAALYEPFPSGKVETDLVFGRYLGLIRARAATEILTLGQVVERLPALYEQAKQSPSLSVGGAIVEADTKGGAYLAGGRKLELRGEAESLSIGWEQGFGEGPIGKLVVHRHDVASHSYDPKAATYYDVPGSSLEDVALTWAAKLPKEDNFFAKKSEDERTLDRFGGIDLPGLAMLAKLLAGDAPKVHAAIDREVARAEKKIAETLPAFATKADFIGKYRDLAELVKKEGELVLGDADTYVSIADKFVKEWSHDDVEGATTLVEGRGPLLIIDNHFGGLGHAIPLESLAKGELEIFLSHEEDSRGKLHLTADGKGIEVPAVGMARRLADDLLEYLPAGVENR